MHGIPARAGRGRPPMVFIVTLLAAVTLAAGACSGSPKAPGPPVPGRAAASPKPSAVTLPGTPAGAQLRWLIAATAHLPIAGQEVRAHFDKTFLALVSPAELNQGLQGATGVTPVQITVSQPRTIVAIVATGGKVGRVQVALAVDSRGLISGLRISPATPPPPPPASWAGVDAALRPLAPEVRLLVASVSHGTCQPIHSIDPGTAAPLGSAFKLYVLDALASAVAAGKVRWDQPLTITAQLKSLPSGVLQNQPDGTRVPVRDAATKMISISDNTAANMIMNLVGRPAVEAVLKTTGMADPARDEPFLTTREMFILKLDQWPELAKRYLAADQAGRRALLAGIDRDPLPAIAAARTWTTPRDIDSIEWFASATDICRAYASLAGLAARPGLSPVGGVLSANNGGLQLDPARWKTIWFKGGSEPGVLTLTYLATTRAGRSYVVVVLAENPSKPISEATAAPAMISAIEGAFTLAARG